MAALQGMTGFARISGEADWGAWAWEAKSVNGRGLDVRVATPPGFDALQRDAKAEAAKRFKRGSLQVSLRIETASDDGAATINQAALKALTDAFKAETGAAPEGQSLATLLSARGVFELESVSTRDLAEREDVGEVLRSGLTAALDALKHERAKEGEAMHGVLSGLVDEMEAVAGSAVGHAAGQPKALKERLEKTLMELGADKAIDAERLAAEAALSAAKADVREELDRLYAHFRTARALLAENGPVGRKLDFLAQELNREANTLCSKSTSLELTNDGLALKALTDQFKEQAANVE
ncbi:MAG: DUF1732 domain-containing protein [Pseudomonadota bacterium]